MRRILLLFLALTAAAGFAGCARPVSERASETPINVLLITVDTLRADALGSYGNARAATPWMDRLAAGGVRFDAAHAHAVVTLPSHASILSGVYPQDHGVRDNAGFRFPDTTPTLATALAARGYATAAFISAFPLDSRFGLARGFAVYDDRFIDASPRPPMLEQERAGTATVAAARRWLDAHASERTFCWVHLYEPHAPYAPPEPFASRFRDDPYAGEVAAADAALEPLLRPILDAGAAGRTIVVLTADHGEALGDHGEATHGVFAYESTLRVPLIIYAPARLRPAVVAAGGRHVDVLPTVLEALDVPLPGPVRGRSLLAAAGGSAASPPEASYFESLSPAFNRGWAPLRGIVRGDLKYIELPIPELYDLRGDAREAHNLIDTRAADARALREALAAAGAAAAAERGGVQETAEARARLEALGYAARGLPLRSRYDERDDPKRLIGLDAKLQEAVRLYSSGNRPRAREIAADLVRERPGMRVAWMTLAQIERDDGRLDAAILAMRRAHDLAPEDAQTTALLGAYLTERGAAADAVALLTPAARDEHADLQVLVALAIAQGRSGRGADAVATLQRAVAAHPGNGMLLVDLGTIELMTGKRDEARRSFQAAIAANGELPRAHSSIAAMHAEDGRAADAIAEWRQAVRLDPAEYGRIYQLGVAFAQAGRNGPARTCLGFFVETAPAATYEKQIALARRWLKR